MLEELTIEVTKTSTGHADYVQIRSGGAGVPVNIVLIAGAITIKDERPKPEGKDAVGR